MRALSIHAQIFSSTEDNVKYLKLSSGSETGTGCSLKTEMRISFLRYTLFVNILLRKINRIIFILKMLSSLCTLHILILIEIFSSLKKQIMINHFNVFDIYRNLFVIIILTNN